MPEEKARTVDGFATPQLEADGYTEEIQVRTTRGNNHDEVPDGGYGWVVIIACFTINGFTWGIWYVDSCLVLS